MLRSENRGDRARHGWFSLVVGIFFCGFTGVFVNFELNVTSFVPVKLLKTDRGKVPKQPRLPGPWPLLEVVRLVVSGDSERGGGSPSNKH